MAANRRGKDPSRMRAEKVPKLPRRALILPEMHCAACSIQWIGRHCAMVENHGGLLSLGRERVAVRTKDGVLSVRGRELTLSEVRPDALVVQGIITGIGYAEDGNA